MAKQLTDCEKLKLLRFMIGECDYDAFHMPIIRKSNLDKIDLEKVKFQGVQSISAKKDNSKVIVHMFRKDDLLLRYWNNPLRYIPMFKTCAAVATPDFSIYPHMDYNEVRYNIYKNRWLGCLYQNYGCTVIPTIGWESEELYDICFSGVEYGSPVLIICHSSR